MFAVLCGVCAGLILMTFGTHDTSEPRFSTFLAARHWARMIDPKGSFCGDVEGFVLWNLPDVRIPNSCQDRQIDAVSWAAGLFHRL